MQGRSNRVHGAVAAVALMLCAAVDSREIPLTELAGAGERDYWVAEEVNRPGALQALQSVVGGPPVPLNFEQDRAVQIALIYADRGRNDFLPRQTRAMRLRLEQLGIRFKTHQFPSHRRQHELQSTYTDAVLDEDERFDYVIFGPSDLRFQISNIKRLVVKEGLQVVVWAAHTPLKEFGAKQPLAWLDFSNTVAARELCGYLAQRLAPKGQFALIRGRPGMTDDQRSGDFSRCLQETTHWTLAHEHYGEYLRDGGYDGAQRIATTHANVGLIHNANAAMASGAMALIEEYALGERMLVTGWGGDAGELEAIRRGRLTATPMWMVDDIGVATAETIKYHLQGRSAELPLVFIARVAVAHDQMEHEQLDALRQEAFRFSGANR